MFYVPAGTRMGLPAGRATTSGGLNSRWISQMHRYGRLPVFYVVPESD